MKWLIRTIGTTIVVLVVLSIIGVEPLAAYKSNIANVIADQLSHPGGTSSIASIKEIRAGVANQALYVVVCPEDSAVPGKTYNVELYRDNKLRGRTAVSWNQPQIDIHKETVVTFSLSAAELEAYRGQQLNRIFSAKVVDSAK